MLQQLSVVLRTGKNNTIHEKGMAVGKFPFHSDRTTPKDAGLLRRLFDFRRQRIGRQGV
jgi:hypothetical protein